MKLKLVPKIEDMLRQAAKEEVSLYILEEYGDKAVGEITGTTLPFAVAGKLHVGVVAKVNGVEHRFDVVIKFIRFEVTGGKFSIDSVQAYANPTGKLGAEALKVWDSLGNIALAELHTDAIYQSAIQLAERCYLGSNAIEISKLVFKDPLEDTFIGVRIQQSDEKTLLCVRFRRFDWAISIPREPAGYSPLLVTSESQAMAIQRGHDFWEELNATTPINPPPAE